MHHAADRGRSVTLVTIAVVVAVWLAGAVILRAYIADQIGTYGLGEPYPDSETSPGLLVPSALAVPLGALGGWTIHLRPPTGTILASAAALVAATGAVLWAAFPVGLRFGGDQGPVWASTVELAWTIYGLAALLFVTGIVIGVGGVQLIRCLHRRA